MNDISGQIGALELGDHMDNHSDGVLEEAGANMALGPTEVNCGRNPTIVFRCATDGALEAAATNISLSPSQKGICVPTMFPCISDGALEAAGAIAIAPPTYPVPVTICCGAR